MQNNPKIIPPETIEGWYSLHQVYKINRAAIRALGTRADAMLVELRSALRELARPAEGGWTAAVRLIGSSADFMLIHFRPTLDALGDVERRWNAIPAAELLRPEYSFLSVTEAGLYAATAQLAAEMEARGGEIGDAAYRAAIGVRIAAERASEHVQRRLYPPLPDDMPYVSFYPMSKRRDPGANWYTMPIGARSELMRAHGLTGRRYAGRIQQIINGAVGFEEWEWGVKLFAKDPLDIKRLVTDMRFDEVSAKYALFGDFWVGKVSSPEVLLG
jgi:peroxiredoxin